ncbi:ATP-binding protein [Rathayibacter soli]|uniref:ATP-binding protein n=1 Tax=Rathayibacter soli TaxID=3144168 RepID=UPI0027E55B7A|nr:ATP-binding protein [Glaciibacter superstes]
MSESSESSSADRPPAANIADSSIDAAPLAQRHESESGQSTMESLHVGILKLVEALYRVPTTEAFTGAVLDGVTQLFQPASCAVLWFGDDLTESSDRNLKGPLDSQTVVQVRTQLSEELSRATQKGTDLWIASDETEPAASLLHSLLHTRVNPIRAIPIAADDTLLGAILITSDDNRRYAQHDPELLNSLGKQIGYAVSQLHARAQTATALEETTKKLHDLEAKMNDLSFIVRSIADTVKVAVIFYDTDNHPQMHNRMVDEILTLTGYDPKTGKSTHVYASDRRTPVKRDKDIVSETIEGDQRGVIYWVGDPDNDDQRAVLTEAHRITRPDGEPLGSAVVTYDVTDLANAIEVREDYLATISHELRTPLTSIVGYLDLITDTHDLAELGLQHEFQTIQHNVDQMVTLVRDLASAGAQEHSLRIEPVDLASVVSQSIHALRPSIDQGGHRLELELPPSSLIGQVDVARLTQALNNIVSNAVKYTPAGGTITVSLTRDGDDAVIRIADNGRGISKNDQARVFERFFRAPEVREAAIQGVGIGLPIAKTIIEAHDGTITLESQLGTGTTFTTRLPLHPHGAPFSSLPEHP